MKMQHRIRAIERVLVANRGEIAVRIIRAAKDLGIATVAAYADSDQFAPFVTLADDAISLAGDSATTTYLDGEKLIAAALRSGADALHPGYGFLSENPDFAGAVNAAGLLWIGPPERSIRLLGDKLSAREIARTVGAALVPGSGVVNEVSQIQAFIAEHGLPIVIKAAFGGGGRAMRVLTSSDKLERQFDSAQREAMIAFGRGECFLERYIERPRHIEVQILGDNYGSIVVVGTRDCTLQRRHQKVVEEAPAPFLTTAQKEIVSDSAMNICRAAGYVGAGTVEFLLGEDGKVSFMEVNTRLQVEHPVTEETAGIDLVCEQFRIAAGESIEYLEGIVSRGHALEFRINAEDPASNFLPSLGTIGEFRLPSGPGVRVDAGVEGGDVIGGKFDSLIAKLIVTGADRAQAIRRARRALDEFSVRGVATTLPLHHAIIRDPEFATNDVDEFFVHTNWIETQLLSRVDLTKAIATTAIRDVTIEIGGRFLTARLPEGLDPVLVHRRKGDASDRHVNRVDEQVLSPMQGTVIEIAVSEGQNVSDGHSLFVIEAMKMENTVLAHRAGSISDLAVTIGQSVRQGLVLCLIVGDEKSPSEAEFLIQP
jgi:acetyl-CoA/propionyl-CoA carboxylase biotin carboxyl carrier protein